jgi:hypothetical protein
MTYDLKDQMVAQLSMQQLQQQDTSRPAVACSTAVLGQGISRCRAAAGPGAAKLRPQSSICVNLLLLLVLAMLSGQGKPALGCRSPGDLLVPINDTTCLVLHVVGVKQHIKAVPHLLCSRTALRVGL